MLVLSRKQDEELVIGTDAQVIVRVLSVVGNKVKLGVIAAPAISVMRGELLTSRLARAAGQATAKKQRPIA